jgi:hypothetical protein
MLWSEFVEGFKKEIMPKDQIAGLDVVYVISQKDDTKRFKIGITETNIYNRLNAYQTPFVDFEIHFLLLLPPYGARRLELTLQNDSHLKPVRIEFPVKKVDQKVRMSEWFKTSASMIQSAILTAVKTNDDINPYIAFRLHNSKIYPWHIITKYNQSRREKVRERVRENAATEKYAKYIGLEVEAASDQGGDEGEVIDIFQLKNKKPVKVIIKYSDREVYPLPIKSLNDYISMMKQDKRPLKWVK